MSTKIIRPNWVVSSLEKLLESFIYNLEKKLLRSPRTRRKMREEGLFHMIGRTKFGTVGLDVDLGEKLLVVCNYCPWCSLTSILPHLNSGVKMKSVLYKMPRLEIRITEDCIGWGKCTEDACFIDEIEMKGKRL